MVFAKQDFTQRVGRLEKLLEQDFSVLAQVVRKGGYTGNGTVQHSQKLIEQLQYHDIIRQKVQHVGQFADLLEAESVRYANGHVAASVLPGLLELSMALLQFVRLEYDEIREEIRQQLDALKLKNMQLDLVYQNFQLEIQEVIKYLGKLYLQLESSTDEQDMELSAEQLRTICSAFSMQTEREIFRSLFDRELLPNEMHGEEENTGSVELF